MGLFLQAMVHETVFNTLLLEDDTIFNTLFCLGGKPVLNTVSKVLRIADLFSKHLYPFQSHFIFSPNVQITSSKCLIWNGFGTGLEQPCLRSSRNYFFCLNRFQTPVLAIICQILANH